jgi:hypothetical protein
LATFLCFALDTLIDHLAQQFPYISPADVGGGHLPDGRERSSQAALDVFCRSQSPGDSSLDIQANKLLDCRPRCRCGPAFLFFCEKITPGTRCLG